MDNISFSGGFLIEKPSIRKWNNIKKVLKDKRKCVFENYNENGDKFFAVRTCEDANMVSILLRRKLNFKFFPDINLKSRLDSDFPEEARKVVDAQVNIMETSKQLRNFVKQSVVKVKRANLFKKYHWKENDHIEKTYKAIGLNPNKYKTCIIKGITYIKDKSGKVVAKASPNNERGVNFVYVYPKNLDESSIKFALTQKGEKEYFGPLQYLDFNEKFKRNVRVDNGRKRPQR